ncbi:3-dehydroquinate synthase [Defluviicoccus vanus]|uniref:3-dehydroquinate synthase n=1 Tax=Defluviicoccus vanus TaxID=111831 RepID=A0A7H1MXL1_9PROT|nr:3-dehydroquinate synthase [Defluviicoccus vanus]QNT68197.1 3-dehydroquinate synthase [Defluviicoccus vanus]
MDQNIHNLYLDPFVCNARFAVPLDFPVHFTNDALHLTNRLLCDAIARREPGRRHRLCCIIDAGVASAWPSLPARLAAYMDAHHTRLHLVAPPMVIPGGEACKNDPPLLQEILGTLQRCRIDRHAFVLAIGGGAVLDLVGFAAAITHRGVRLVRMPTTVLGQNDAGIGVKNAVNAFGCKNYLGTFAPPWAVINDLDFIETLDTRDKIAGIAEAVKVALIRDGVFFQWLETNACQLSRFARPSMATMIRGCAELHLRHIAGGGDPFESGSARPLDYGHWAAHKLETLSGHTLRHGEAVAINIALDTRYATVKGLLAAAVAERVYALLETVGFCLWHPALAERNSDGRLSVLNGLREFQEHLGGELSIPLLSAIGTSVDVEHIDEAAVVECIAWLQQRDAGRCA